LIKLRLSVTTSDLTSYTIFLLSELNMLQLTITLSLFSSETTCIITSWRLIVFAHLSVNIADRHAWRWRVCLITAKHLRLPRITCLI